MMNYIYLSGKNCCNFNKIASVYRQIALLLFLISPNYISATEPDVYTSVDGRTLKYGKTYTESFDTQNSSYSINPINPYLTTSTWTVSFTVTNTMEVFISTCGSEIDAYLTLIRYPGNEFISECDDVLSGLDLEYGYTPCANECQAEITTVLGPGSYNLILQGADFDMEGTNNGLIQLTIQTKRREEGLINGFNPPINLGIIDEPQKITVTKNTQEYINTFAHYGLVDLNQHTGDGAGDIVYQFEVKTPRTLTINNTTTNGWLQLLDANKNKINTGITNYITDAQTNITYPSKYSINLTAGIYYIVSSKFNNMDGDVTVDLEYIPPTATLAPDPTINSNSYTGKNYITSSSFTIPVSGNISISPENSLTTIQYFDGLGRPIQTVQRGITPTKQDLATYTEYDGAGREWKQYLPIPSAGNGAFVDYSAFNSGTGFYTAEGRPYAETLFEASPLNRVLGAKKPGNAWNAHPSAINYDGNDTIPYFYVDNNTQKLTRGTPYAAYTLYKTTVTDEDGKSATEYKDKLGQVILKCNASDVFTYYVYNDLAQLAYVLPPLAYDNLLASTAVGSVIEDTNAELLKYAYLYKYDESGNCIAKRLPGCDWIYMVYDKADRLILSQDGNQRPNNQWTVSKYDVFGRVLYTGITTEATTHSNLIADLKDEVITESWNTDNDFYNIGYTCGRFAPTQLLTVSYYDTYDFVALTNTQLTYDNSKESEYGIRYSSAKSLLTGTRTYLLDNSGTIPPLPCITITGAALFRHVALTTSMATKSAIAL